MTKVVDHISISISQKILNENCNYCTTQQNEVIVAAKTVFARFLALYQLSVNNVLQRGRSYLNGCCDVEIIFFTHLLQSISTLVVSFFLVFLLI